MATLELELELNYQKIRKMLHFLIVLFLFVSSSYFPFFFLLPRYVESSGRSSPRETRSHRSLAILFGNPRRSRSLPIYASTLPPFPLAPIIFARSASLSGLRRSSAVSSACPRTHYAPSRSPLVHNLFTSSWNTARVPPRYRSGSYSRFCTCLFSHHQRGLINNFDLVKRISRNFF